MSTTRTTRTTRRLALGLAALLGLGVVGVSAPAGAGIDDITSCPEPTAGSFCDGDDTPFDGPDDFAPGGNGPDEPGDQPEAQPEPDDGDLPPAEVDGTVVADANFTG